MINGKKMFFLAVTVYIFSLIITAPAHAIYGFLKQDNETVVLKGLKGTIWHGKVDEIVIHHRSIRNIMWECGLYGLYKGMISCDWIVNDEILSGKGKIGIEITGGRLINDVILDISVQTIISYLKMPDIGASGSAMLRVKNLYIKDNLVKKLDGHFLWTGAEIQSHLGDMRLGGLEVKMIAGDSGDVSMTITDTENQLDLHAYLDIKRNGAYKIHGDVKPVLELFEGARSFFSAFSVVQDNGRLSFQHVGSVF